MDKELLKKRLVTLTNEANQTMANYNALLGAKAELEGLLAHLNAVEEKEKLEKELAEKDKQNCETLDHCVGDEQAEVQAANGN